MDSDNTDSFIDSADVPYPEAYSLMTLWYGTVGIPEDGPV